MPPRSKHHSCEASLDISFENTVQNKSLQPCDLNGFMDYLYYVERRAENLQFFLWFCDYVERWSRLPSHQRQAAPPPPPTYNYAGAGGGSGAGRQHMLHSRGPSTSSNYRHHRSYSHTYSSHSRTMSTETVPYRPRSNSMASVASAATAASVSSMAMSASARTSLSFTSLTSLASVKPSRTSRPSHVSIHQRADNDKLANILTLLENLPEAAEHSPRHSLVSPREPPDWCLHYQQALLHEQPLRGEMDRIVAHYIAADGARALPDVDLFAPERAACLRAAKHTTHPSALLPAFLAADAALREQLFPAFVKSWCVGNIDPWSPRFICTQIASVLLLALGAAVLVLLVLYEHSNAPRLVCLLMWWPALSLLVLSWYRIDLPLYVCGQRLLRPWEAEDDAVSVRSLDLDLEKSLFRRGHSHQVSTSSVVSASSRVDPLRKTSLQAFGPRNDPDSEAWMVRQTRIPLFRRLLCQLSQLSPSGQRTASIQHEGVKARQKRAVWTAVMSAGFVSAVLALASLFIPVT
ncbi:regulator of g protein [Ophiostoma piceae UAMH 11346]|uniref:Regulator of g protein n=1 Tax=Ophiostoma piceae (strain UAMH 11346) TaxID=1262450 RepID=S3C687_OPHP1|nr:regulator of g protein [Ophiostoma piceae UAMH 11346]